MRRAAQHIIKTGWRISFFLILALLLFAIRGAAQPPLKNYTIKNGQMHIAISKDIGIASLDSFITQYGLQSLALNQFFTKGFEDSLKKQGWKVVINNDEVCIFTKLIEGLADLDDHAEKIRLMEKKQFLDGEFPAVSNKVVMGYNRFRNKQPFRITEDSLVVFYLRNNQKAGKVMLAGSFNNWVPDNLPMTKTDSGWIASVKLKPGKYWYKFIVDGNWIIDMDNRLNENDGRGNINSVFYYNNYVFRLNGYTNAKKVFVSGSFNDWQEGELTFSKTATGWEFPLYLADGTHTYKFVVDGKWITDPLNNDKYPNEFNDFNSVIRMGKMHLFFLPGFPDAKQVILAGSFNKWRDDELYMKKTAAGWELYYTLGAGNYEYKYKVDGKWVTDTVGQYTNPGKKESSYFIIDPNYTFRLKGFANARSVFLAGDFNDWSPNSLAMKKEGDEWVFTVHLDPGKHLYKFIVDGKWIIDPGNKLWEDNEHSSSNSVLWIEKQ